MEDDLKNKKHEYLSILWSDLIQIWNLGSGDQAKFKWRQPPMEDNLKNYQASCYGNLKWRQPPIEDNLNLRLRGTSQMSWKIKKENDLNKKIGIY